MCVINHLYSVPKIRLTILAEVQQAIPLWQTWPTESSIQTFSGWEILHWKEGLLLENVRQPYTWLPSPSKWLSCPAWSICVQACVHVCMYVLSNRECHCCKTSLQNSFCLGFPAQHSLAQYKQGTFSRACLDNNLEKTMASERAWC